MSLSGVTRKVRPDAIQECGAKYRFSDWPYCAFRYSLWAEPTYDPPLRKSTPDRNSVAWGLLPPYPLGLLSIHPFMVTEQLGGSFL